MNGDLDDLMDDLLPLVISGILDPRYITGRDEEKDPEKEDGEEGRKK